jgi:hypothetical protein
MLLSRLLGGSPPTQPKPLHSTREAQIDQAQQAVDAATRADHQRINQAMDGLDGSTKP